MIAELLQRTYALLLQLQTSYHQLSMISSHSVVSHIRFSPSVARQLLPCTSSHSNAVLLLALASSYTLLNGQWVRVLRASVL